MQVGVHEGVGHAVGGLHHGGVDALVGIVAAAAAVGIAYVHGVRDVGLGGAQLDGGTHIALHPAGDVVAAVEGVDGVGAVHGDVGVAADVGHTAAADHIALDHRGVLGLGERLRGHLDGEVEVHTVFLHHTVVVGDGDVDPATGTAVGHAGAVHLELLFATDGDGGGVHPAQGTTGDGELLLDHADALVGGGGGCNLAGMGVAVPVVVGAGGGRTGAAVARVAAQAVVGVYAGALGLLGVLVVAWNDGDNIAGRHGDLGRGHHLVAILEDGLVESDTRQALAGGEEHLPVVVLHLDRQIEGCVAGRLQEMGNGIEAGVAVGDFAAVDEDTALGTVVGVAGHAPLAVGRNIVGAHGVEHNPVVAFVALAVTVGDVGDGGTEVPVVELGIVGRGGSHLHLLHTQLVARADEVVAVVVPLLEVVSGEARALPHAETVEAGAGHVDDLRHRTADVEGKVEGALAGLQVDGRGAVDLGAVLSVVEGHLRSMAFLAFEPREGSVGEGVVARVALLRTQALLQHHGGNERQQGQGLAESSQG